MSDNLRDEIYTILYNGLVTHREVVGTGAVARLLTDDALMPRIEQARLEALNNGLRQGYDTGYAQGQARFAAILGGAP